MCPSKFNSPEDIGAPKAGNENKFKTFHEHSVQDNLNTCSMRKQNVKKANKTAEVDASCDVICYASENTTLTRLENRTPSKKKFIQLGQLFSEAFCVVYSFVCLQTALGDNVWLQHKLIESLVGYSDVEEAARWAMFYRLPQSSLPSSVKRALDSWLVC